MKKNGAQSLSEAIEKLESVGSSTAQGLKEIFERDFAEIKKSLDTLKPHLADLKDNLEEEVYKKKDLAETKLKQNPWLALGIIGLIALFIGFILGTSRKKDD